MPVQKGAPAPSKLFITKADAPAAPPPPAQVVQAAPAQQGMNLKDITSFLQALPPVVWDRLLAPRTAPAAAQPGAGMVMVSSDGMAPAQALPAPKPGPGPSVLELQARLRRLSPEEQAKLLADLAAMIPPEMAIARLPDFIQEDHAILACGYLAENFPQTNPPK